MARAPHARGASRRARYCATAREPCARPRRPCARRVRHRPPAPAFHDHAPRDRWPRSHRWRSTLASRWRPSGARSGARRTTRARSSHQRVVAELEDPLARHALYDVAEVEAEGVPAVLRIVHATLTRRCPPLLGPRGGDGGVLARERLDERLPRQQGQLLLLLAGE